jgi:hypothetical protein
MVTDRRMYGAVWLGMEGCVSVIAVVGFGAQVRCAETTRHIRLEANVLLNWQACKGGSGT